MTNKNQRVFSRREFISLIPTGFAAAALAISQKGENQTPPLEFVSTATPTPTLDASFATPSPTLTPTPSPSPTATEISTQTPTPEDPNLLALKYATGEHLIINNQKRFLPTGILFPKINFTDKIVQQPSSNYSWVSQENFTAFAMPEFFDAHGVLAEHCYSNNGGLGGLILDNLRWEDEVVLFLGDGSYNNYSINQISALEALSPRDPSGDFLDPQTGKTYTAKETFFMFYTVKDRLTIQTCSADGRLRIFFVGEPNRSDNLQSNAAI